VVATGIGHPVERQVPTKVVDNTAAPRQQSLRRANGDFDEQLLDMPAVSRRAMQGGQALAERRDPRQEPLPSEDFLDIPAFLRRQAD